VINVSFYDVKKLGKLKSKALAVNKVERAKWKQPPPSRLKVQTSPKTGSLEITELYRLQH
jgi:hypothetical protein